MLHGVIGFCNELAGMPDPDLREEGGKGAVVLPGEIATEGGGGQVHERTHFFQADPLPEIFHHVIIDLVDPVGFMLIDGFRKSYGRDILVLPAAGQLA